MQECIMHICGYMYAGVSVSFPSLQSSQHSIGRSTVKWERTWYLFLHEQHQHRNQKGDRNEFNCAGEQQEERRYLATYHTYIQLVVVTVIHTNRGTICEM